MGIDSVFQLVAHVNRKDAIGRLALGLQALSKQSGARRALIFTERQRSLSLGRWGGALRPGLLASEPAWGGSG